MPTTFTRRQRRLFIAATIALSLVVSVAALFAADIYFHHKLATSAGLNVWGYRGPTVGRKQTRERRLVVLGGSTAFGYGVHAEEALPAVLQDLLRQRLSQSGETATVVNLAFNMQGAHSYAPTLADYEYLDYDGVVFYSGYNDLKPGNLLSFRHDSAIFRLTGYFPILPLVVREKAMAIRNGGNIDAGYLGKQVVFRPNVTQRTTAAALEAAAHVADSLDAQFRTTEVSAMSRSGVGAECGVWSFYCGEMYDAVKFALDRGKHVLIVTQPHISALHTDQQRALNQFLVARFGNSPLLQFADVSTAVDLGDPSICFDGLHLTAKGNRELGEALEPAVENWVRRF